MYLLFADESGTHGGSHAFVVGGLAVHEQDAQSLQRALNRCVERGLRSSQVDEYEPHAAEMRNPKKPKEGSRAVPSPWAFVDRSRRLLILDAVYEVLSSFPRYGHSSTPMVEAHTALFTSRHLCRWCLRLSAVWRQAWL